MKKVLNEKEFEIIYAIYFEKYTMESLAKKYNVSKERVRLTTCRALVKLSNSGLKVKKEISDEYVIAESKLKSVLEKIDELVSLYSKKIDEINTALEVVNNDYLKKQFFSSQKFWNERLEELKLIYSRIQNFLNNLKT